MKKRIASLLLCLVMVLGMLPTTAWAETTDVAKVEVTDGSNTTTTCYEAFGAALTAANAVEPGKTVKLTLLANCQESTDRTICRDMTLDFGGKTLTRGSIASIQLIVSGATVTIQDTASGSAAGRLGDTLKVESGSAVTINGGYINAVYNYATLTIQNGTFGTVNNASNATLTISGGTFNQTLNNYGRATISGGTFCGAVINSGANDLSKSASLTISGGVFTYQYDRAIRTDKAGETAFDLLAEGYACRYYKNDTAQNEWHTDETATTVNGKSGYDIRVVKAPLKSFGIFSNVSADERFLDAGYTDSGIAFQPNFSPGEGYSGVPTYQWYIGTEQNTLFTDGNKQAASGGQIQFPAGKGIGTYYVGCIGTMDGYSKKSNVMTVTVGKRTLAATATMSDYTYGGTVSTPDVTGNTENGAVTYYYNMTNSNSGGREWKNMTGTTLDVGSYYLYATIAETKTYNAFTTAPVAFTIAPKSIAGAAVVLENDTFYYNGSAQTARVESVTLPDGTVLDAGDYTVSGNSATDVDDYTLSVSGAGNYTGTVENIAWKILSSEITNISAAQTGTLTYNGQPQTAQVSASATAQGGQSVTFTYSTAQDGTYTEAVPAFTDAGEHTVWYKVNAPHHVEKSGSFKVTIAPKALTITAKPKTIIYGDAPANDGVSYDGFVSGENATVLTGTLEYAYSYTQLGDVGNSYTITPSGLSSTNYAITFVPGTLTVSPKNIAEAVITLAQSSFVYDGTAKTQTVTSVTLTGFDNLTCDISGNVQTNAGTHTITVSGTGNFTGTATTTFSIAKATPTGKPAYRQIFDAFIRISKAELSTKGGTFSVPGTVEWVDESGEPLDVNTFVRSDTAYRWRFHPTDSTNYNDIFGEIVLWHYEEVTLPTPETKPEEPASLSFRDVDPDDYFYNPVYWAVENGVTTGTSRRYFSPYDACTRAQAVTFLWRAAGCPEPESREMPFTDVSKSSYYYDAVLWAVENGITKGTSATTFGSDGTCTRSQIVTFLWRTLGEPAGGTETPFTDVTETAYYAQAVLWAVAEKVTTGTSATTFSPDEDCTRAQIVTFLYRALAK